MSILVAANSEADPARFEEACKYESAKVVEIVASHATALPRFQGINETSSERFAVGLPLIISEGSFVAGTSADVKALVMMSLIA